MAKTKQLFVLIQDCGDGSYHPRYTFNKKWVLKQQARYDSGEVASEDVGVDGDGFHYDTLRVPADATLKSLGVGFDCAEEG